MHFSSYLQGILAGYVRGSDLPAPPTSLEIALSSADPTADGSGLSEPPAGDGYARQSLVLTAPTSTNTLGSSCFNTAPITFGPVSNTAWPTVTHVAVLDNSGNLLMYGPLNVQRTPPVGDALPFSANALQIQISAYFGAYFAELILNWLRGNSAPSAPLTTTLGLSLADPLEDGTALDEPILGYTRQTVTFTTSASTEVGTPIISEGPYLFGPADSAWGLITHAVVFTSAGDILLKGPVAVQRDVTSGDSFAIPSGALTVYFS